MMAPDMRMRPEKLWLMSRMFSSTGLSTSAGTVFGQFFRRHFVIKRIAQRRTRLVLANQQVECFGTFLGVEGFRDFINDQTL